MALPLKQHDRRPWLVAQLQNKDGSGIDLTGALSVEVIVRTTGAASTAPPLFKEPCEVLVSVPGGIPEEYDDGAPVTDLDGWVRYKWAIGDTDATGTYDVEWEILWAVDDPQTVPTVGYYTVEIGDDLDAD